MSDLFFSTDIFNDIDRLQRQFANLFANMPTSLRASRVGTFPAVNIGSTDESIEIVAFAPGLDPTQIDVSIDNGLLILSGERKRVQPERADDTRTYLQERFSGTFRRIIELPHQADPDKIQARYVNGCLSVTIGKLEASKPRAITVQ
jgi:HSP20 family protein